MQAVRLSPLGSVLTWHLIKAGFSLPRGCAALGNGKLLGDFPCRVFLFQCLALNYDCNLNVQPLLFLILCFLGWWEISRCLSENLLAPDGTSEGQERRGRVWDVLRDVQDLPECCPAWWCDCTSPNVTCLICLGH